MRAVWERAAQEIVKLILFLNPIAFLWIFRRTIENRAAFGRLFNNGIYPVVYEQGSLGASGFGAVGTFGTSSDREGK